MRSDFAEVSLPTYRTVVPVLFRFPECLRTGGPEVALRRQVFIFACWKRNIKLQVWYKKLDAKILGANQLVRV